MLQDLQTYSFSFDFGWLAGTLAVLLIGAIGLTLPYELFGIARANCYASDGRRDPARTVAELRALSGFLADIVLAPLLAVALTVGGVLAVHHFVIPIPLIVDIAEMYDVDPAAWDERTETGKLGDVGEIYGAWSTERGFSDERALTVRRILKTHWATLAIAGVAFLILIYWFFSRIYVTAIAQYSRGLVERSAAHSEDNASGPP